jgi:hypothetical protein
MQEVIQLLQKNPDAFPSIEIKFCAEVCSQPNLLFVRGKELTQ